MPLNHPDLHSLIDKVYEAALDSEQWDEFARLLQRAFAAEIAGLFVQDKWRGQFRRAALLGMPTAFAATYSSADEHLDQPGACNETEFYNDWVKDVGLMHVMGSSLRTHGPDAVTFTVMRSPARGPFQPHELQLYEALRPHIGRAIDISGRLEDLQWRVHAHSQLKERLPIGLILLDSLARIVDANARAEEWLAAGDPLQVRERTLAARAPRNHDRLQQILSDAIGFREAQGAPETCLLALHSSDGSATVSITAVPLPRGQTLFAEDTACAAVFLSSPGQREPLRRDRLEAVYGLTRAEAWLTSQLVAKADLKEAARAIGVAHETARGYLKAVLHKTGTHSQTEMLQMLLSDWSLLVGHTEPRVPD